MERGFGGGDVTHGVFVLKIIEAAKNNVDSDATYLSDKTDRGIYYSSIKGLSDGTDGAKLWLLLAIKRHLISQEQSLLLMGIMLMQYRVRTGNLYLKCWEWSITPLLILFKVLCR